MTKISFANPLFLYLLLIVPAMVVFYVLKQSKSNASLNVPGLQQFSKAMPTFRVYLRHILFGLRAAAVTLLIIVLARPQAVSSYQDVSTEGIDIMLSLDISGSMLARRVRGSERRHVEHRHAVWQHPHPAEADA